MTAYEYIAEHLKDTELLAGLAEEASELAQAALKLRRAIDGTNPTPVTESEARDNLIEEIADVLFCMEMLGYDSKSVQRLTAAIREAKTPRWAKRLGWKEEE